MMTTKQNKPINKTEKHIPEKNQKRKIKSQNYLILTIIFIVTFLLVILLRYWYISYRDYQLTIPVLKGTLNEVTVAELDHYITANPNAVIYIEVSEDGNSREVAKDLIDVVKRRELSNKIVYLNLSSVDDKDKFFADFSKNYMEDKKLDNYPALVLFIDGKVDAFVSRTEKQSLNIGNLEQIFDEYELEGE